MKIPATLTIAGAFALALGLSPLALAQSPPTGTAMPPATASRTASSPTPATHKMAAAVTASRSQIRQAQQALVALGYHISVDGKMGPQTRKALRKFQKVNGIPQSGRLGTDTKRALGLIGGQPPAGLDLGGYTKATVSTTSSAPTPSSAPAPSTAPSMSTSGTPWQRQMRGERQAMLRVPQIKLVPLTLATYRVVAMRY